MTKTFSIKKMLISILIAFALIVSQSGILFGALRYDSHSAVYAAETFRPLESYSEDITSQMTNSDFTSVTGSTYPMTPSGWSKAATESSKVKSGVIDIENTAFNTNYEKYGIALENRPVYDSSFSDTQVLMLNAEDIPGTSGYTSSSIELKANSYYSLTLRVYTSADAAASVYLSGDNIENTATSRFLPVNTNRTWTEYTFWVKTGDTSKENVKLELYLGAKVEGMSTAAETSTGFALFDHVQIKQYSANLFRDTAAQNSKSTIIDLSRPLVQDGEDGYVVNGDFTGAFGQTWTRMEAEKIKGESTSNLVNLNGFVGTADPVKDVAPGTTLGTGSNKALMLSGTNAVDGWTSQDILIKRHAIYRISFWAKGSFSAGNMNVILEGVSPQSAEEGDDATKINASFTTLKSTQNKFTNNWDEYSFYVVGNSTSDCNIKLTLGIGSADAAATGYVFYTDITSQLITADEMSAGTSSNTSNTTLKMFADNSLVFANGSFNFGHAEEEQVTYPLTPDNWTKDISDTTANVLGGIVNIDPAVFASNLSNFGGAVSLPTKNTIVANQPDNVLLIRNMSPTKQGYVSDSTSLEADGYYKFTVEIQTQGVINSRSGAHVILKDENDVVLTQFTVNPDHRWQTYTVYIKNSYNSLNIKAGLYLGSDTEATSGAAFFDNCILTKVEQTDFDAAERNITNTGDFVEKIDMTVDSFDAVGTSSQKVYKPLYWNGTLKNEVVSSSRVDSGIIDTADLPGTLPTQVSTWADEDGKVLMISSEEDVYYYYQNKLTYKFTSGSFYKVSVNVKTYNLGQNPDTMNEDNSAVPGASIIIEGLEKQFTGINTQTTKNPNNDFREYVFYIKADSDLNANIRLGLGSESALTHGYAFFDNLKVTQIEENDYKNALSPYATSTDGEYDLPENIINIGKTSVDDETPTDPGLSGLNWVVIPTVIIALAVIVAVVGYFVRKFLRNRPKGAYVVENSYDRLQTLMKDVDRRNQKSSINLKLKNLEDELKLSEKFLNDEKTEYQTQLSAYGTAKEIAKETPNIEIEEPGGKKHDYQKTIQELENKIAQIKSDITLLEAERARVIKQEKEAIERANKKEKVIKKRK